MRSRRKLMGRLAAYPPKVAGAFMAILATFLIVVAAPVLAFPPHAKQKSWPLAPGLEPLRAYSIAFAPDGELWFAGGVAGVAGMEPTSIGSGLVGHVTPTGELTEIRIGESSKAVVGSIVAGPDGAMWFTMGGADTVGRAALDGTLTGFPVPPGSRPGAIVAGPDGNLWFTEPGVGKVGRMTPSGSLDEFAVGRDSDPSGIAVGADGGLWVTLTHSNRIIRLTPTGERTPFRLPKGTEPRKIVATAAGLWFTEVGQPARKPHTSTKIGFLTTRGRLRQIALPTHAKVTSLAAGPDGTVWYTTAFSPATIGSISPDGTKSRPLCVARECQTAATATAVAPDGTTWFATGQPVCLECGGGTGIASQFYPGTVGYLIPE